MKTINAIFRYLGYATFSFIIGWISYNGETDFIAEIGGTVLTVMLALLSLYVTLSGQVVTHLLSLHRLSEDFEIGGIVDAMKRNVVIEIVLIVLSLVLLATKSFFVSQYGVLKVSFSIGTNAVVVFSILYFVLVVFDSFTGLFKLIKALGQGQNH